MTDIVVAGAGMGGLVAAAHAHACGADVKLLEKTAQPGGNMVLSSGVIWRHRNFDDFRAECPGGDPKLQRLIWERLDQDLEWLRELGAPVVAEVTGNHRTQGVRFDPIGLCKTLVNAIDRVDYSSPIEQLPNCPVILATGGFSASRELRRNFIAVREELPIRSHPGNTGDGLRLGYQAGGALSTGMDQFYGRAMPRTDSEIPPTSFVSAAQLYGRYSKITGSDGESHTGRTWSEIDVVQWMARRPDAGATFEVADTHLEEKSAGRTVAEMIAEAERLGASVRRHDGKTTVEVVASITTTLGGLRIDESARVAPGVFACGQDVGGIATDGYSSGLASALVFGRIAAQSALTAANEGETPRQLVEGEYGSSLRNLV